MKKLFAFLLVFSIIFSISSAQLSAFAQFVEAQIIELDNPFTQFDNQYKIDLRKAAQPDAVRPLYAALSQKMPLSINLPTIDSGIFGERYIVKFKADVSLRKIYSIIGNSFFQPLSNSKQRTFLLYIKNETQFYTEYSDFIEYIERDKERKVNTTSTTSGIKEQLEMPTSPPIYIANDPLLSSQWGIKTFSLDKLWSTTLGSPEIIVAILDSGIDRQHEDLNYSKILAGYDAITRKAGVSDDPLGHGTSVTGIIAAAHNELGCAGIAPNVTILPIRVTNPQDKIYSSDFMAGLRFAADSGAKVINISFGGTDKSNAEQDAINYAAAKGCIIVAASGNGGNSIDNAGKYLYPASYDSVISVGSLNPMMEVSGFSQFNDKVDIVAPGEGIIVLSTDSQLKYTQDSGTSFAAPYVAGVAALVLSAIDSEVKMTSDAFLSILRIAADNRKHDNYFGYGPVIPTIAFSLRNDPIVYGVFNNEVYFKPVTINFTRGTATLNGVPVTNGYKVELNGSHELVVINGEITTKLGFVVDTMPLLFNAPAGDTFYEPISITYTRGTATLNGYPYHSGKRIETSGQYKFLLTGPNGNTAEKVFTMQTDIPFLDGVKDGDVYNTPVIVRQIGEGTVLLNGVKLAEGKEHIISDDGNYTVTLSNYGLTNTKTIKFSIVNDIAQTENLLMLNPKVLLDEQQKLAIVYSSSFKGIRLYNYNNIQSPTKIISLDNAVNGAILTEKYLVLRHTSSLTLIERNKLTVSGTVPIYAVINVNGTLSGVVNAGGLLYAAVSESPTATGLFYINADAKTTRRDVTIPVGSLKIAFSNQTNHIYFWNINGGDALFLYNIQKATLRKQDLLRSLPAGGIACSNGYILVSGTLFQETDLVGAVAKGVAYGTNELLMFSGQIAITQTKVYNAFTNEVLGAFKKKVSSVAVASNNMVFVLFDDRTIEVYENKVSPLALSAIKSGFRLAAIPTLLTGQSTTTSDFSTYTQTLSTLELKNWVYAENTARICAVMENDYNLYLFDNKMQNQRTFPLPMLPRTLTTDGTRVYITFETSDLVYILNTSTLTKTTHKFTTVINARHTEAHSGTLYALSGQDIYMLTAATGAVKRLALGDNAVSFTLNKKAEKLYVSYYGDTDYIDVYSLSISASSIILTKTGRYDFIVSSSTLYCDGSYIYSENLVFDCTQMKLLYAMPGKLRASNGESILLDKGAFNHDTKKITIATKQFEKVIPLLSKNNEVFIFEKNKGFTIIHNPFKKPLGETPEIKLVGQINDSSAFIGAVKVEFAFGYGYHNGYKIESGASVANGGTHNITVVTPLGAVVTKQFTIIPVLSGISIAGGDTYIAVNEARVLSVVYSPSGVEQLPATFSSSNTSIVTVDSIGRIIGLKEGTAEVTASVDGGRFKATITVTVKNNDISFLNNIFYRNAHGIVMVDRAGTTAAALCAAVNKGNGSAVLYSGNKLIPGEHIIGTGNRLSVRNKNGEEIAAAYVAVLGDVNGDGIISINDYLQMQKFIAQQGQMNLINASAADINKSGDINLTDLIMLESHLLARAPLSNFDIKQLSNKDGTAEFLQISGAHIGSDFKLRLSFDKKPCLGLNGAFSFDSDKLDLVAMSTQNENWYLNYAVNGNIVYFNMYAFNADEQLTGFTETSLVATFTLKDNVTSGDVLGFKPLFINTDSCSLDANFLEVIVLPPMSDNSRLKRFVIKGSEDLLAFAPDMLEYKLNVPFATRQLEIIAEAEDSKATVEIDSVILQPGQQNTVKVTVIAENGSITEYIILVERAHDPSIIRSSENRLSVLNPSIGSLSPSFSPDITSYTLHLPKGVYTADFELNTVDLNATINYYLNAAKQYIITCTAEDGSIRKYTITLVTTSNNKGTIGDFIEKYWDVLIYASFLTALIGIGISIRLIATKKIANFEMKLIEKEVD